jgi:hypothetical protein
MNRNNLVRRLAFAAAIAATMGAAACATPSRPEAMALAAMPELTVSAGQPGYHSVTTVTAAGGSETNPMWASQVSNEDLKTAVESSLMAAGYMGSEGQPMTVQVSLMGLDQPSMGLDMSVTSRVRYVVTRGGQPVFNETISARATATMGDAFVGTERLRLANEKSIQENIRQFLTRFRATLR